ncbi:MAG: FAD-dependent oxidoreductase [Alphaproteobacteria bacterium]|nr:FAD-dependent oxidoreductase [Alphaproteobacteria bacterium]
MSKEILTPDVCVIGAGSGGLSVAAGAAQLGLDVVLLEKGKMGGDCLNTGCVPSKALLAAGKRAQMHRKNDIKGIAGHEPDIDFSAVKDHVFETINTIAPHDSPERFQSLSVNVILEAGAFVDEKTVETARHSIRARRFVIATGSTAFVPSIDGLNRDKVYTNESIFDVREKPQHLLILGGGPIGVEMAQAHRRLGCAVSVFDTGGILPRDDQDNVEIVREALLLEGVALYENVEVSAVVHGEGSVSLKVKRDGEVFEVSGSHLLVAAGRVANVEHLGLDKAGVEVDHDGVIVNARLKSSNRRVSAIGDVASGAPRFTHIAGYHAGVIIRQICFGMFWAAVDYTALVWVTYCDPEIAQVGLSEDEARAAHGDDVKVVTWSFDENDRAIAERITAGQIRVVTNKKGRILGASIVGAHAGELIGLWALAVSSKMKIGAVTGMIAPYPTLGEVSKRAAGAWFTPTLFSDKTRRIVSILKLFG